MMPTTVNNNNNKSRQLLLLRLLAVSFAVIFIVGIALLIAYLVVTPKTPSISLSTLSISLRITNSTSGFSDDYSLSSNIDITLSIENPNPVISISYDIDYAVTYYNTSFLGDALSILSFSQKKGKSATFSFEMEKFDTYFDTTNAVSIGTKIARGERVDGIYVKFWSTVTYRSAFRKWKYRFNTMCQGVEVAFDSATKGSMTNGPRLCAIEAYSLR